MEITMDRLRVASSLAIACLTVLVPQVVSAETRALVELFTSEGCSSCPPADKLIGELAKDPSIVAMSLAIDYRDYLGWEDTLALGIVTLFPGLRSVRRFVSRVDEQNPLFRLPVPA